MKLQILSAIAITGLATTVLGQQIILDNIANNSPSSSATSNGQLWETVGGVTSIFDGNDYNVGANVYLGSSVGSLTLYGTYIPSTDPKGYTTAGNGEYQFGPAQAFVTVPGIAAGGTAYVELQIWDYDSPAATGTYSTFAAAVAGNDPRAQAIFTNPTSNPGAAVPPQELSGSPAIVLTTVPEPATFALAGLGLASLLAFRRRS